MKKVVATLGAVAMLSSPAFAGEAVVNDVFKTVTKKIPQTERVCEEGRVPIYEESGMDEQGAIIGGLVGGVIGQQINKGAGTGIGAIAGAIIGGKGEKKIVGYQNVSQCYNKTTYDVETKEVYSYSTVTFYEDGKKYTVKFQK